MPEDGLPVVRERGTLTTIQARFRVPEVEVPGVEPDRSRDKSIGLVNS